MKLDENTYLMVNNILLYGSIILPLLLFLIMFFKQKKSKRKKYLKGYLIIALIICLIMNGLRLYCFKKDDSGKVDTPKTTTTTTTTTEKAKPVNATSKGYEIKYTDGAYYIGGYLIANKTYLLSSEFVPQDTHKAITPEMDGFCPTCIDNEAYSAWELMRSDAKALGLNIWIQSGYRSYDYQGGLYDGYVKRSGKKAADTFSARAGASEHQTGLAFDLNTIDSSFANTEEGKWVNNNAYIYGYIIRYPKNKDNETGYKYEPWHIRYVGKDLAKKLYNDGNWITMEDYFGITSTYKEGE